MFNTSRKLRLKILYKALQIKPSILDGELLKSGRKRWKMHFKIKRTRLGNRKRRKK
jgi:hypothetical protein